MKTTQEERELDREFLSTRAPNITSVLLRVERWQRYIDDIDELARLNALIETGPIAGPFCLSPTDSAGVRALITRHRTRDGGNPSIADVLEHVLNVAERVEPLYEETRALRGMVQYHQGRQIEANRELARLREGLKRLRLLQATPGSETCEWAHVDDIRALLGEEE